MMDWSKKNKANVGSAILRYQQECFKKYCETVGLPRDYSYVDGNRIRPLVPIETCQKSLMIVGAYPSARFESRKGRLVPVADNLGPFQPELYFDGVRVRRQESAYGLEEYILKPLLLRRDQCWITDLVKVFLFKKEHVTNCNKVLRKRKFIETRSRFIEFGRKSLSFLAHELNLAKPLVVLTLGEEVARVIQDDFTTRTQDLLSGVPTNVFFGGVNCAMVHLAHPDASRRFQKWRTQNENALRAVRPMFSK